MNVIEPPHLLGAVGALIVAVAVIAWWLLREAHAKVQAEGKARADALEAERKEREKDRHALRVEIGTVSTKLHAHELHVAEKYVNHERMAERLAAAIKPMEDGITRLEVAVGRIFSLIDRKESSD